MAQTCEDATVMALCFSSWPNAAGGTATFKRCLASSLLMLAPTSWQVVIIDEAHERTVQTDMLFGLMKALLVGQPPGPLDTLPVSSCSASKHVPACAISISWCSSVSLDVCHTCCGCSSIDLTLMSCLFITIPVICEATSVPT